MAEIMYTNPFGNQSNIPRHINWDKTSADNDTQRAIVRYFKNFDDFNPVVDQDDVRCLLKEEFSIFDVSRVEVLNNRDLFRLIKMFLEDKGINLLGYYKGITC